MVETDEARTWRPGVAGRFRTPVRGYRFAARPPGAEHPQAGQRVLLHHERGHPVDRWAVAIWTRAQDGTPWRIGYLERTVASRIGPRVEQGRRITGEVIGWMTEPDGRWRRPVVEVDRDALEGGPIADQSRKTA